MNLTKSNKINDLVSQNKELFSSDLFECLTYANDASHYLLTPTIVSKPKSAQDIGEIFKIVQKLDLGITFRSGGTSLSGQAITDSILVDTRRNFKDFEILEEGKKVRVEPGLTINRINASLKKYGKKLGPDPASEIACTIGGVVSNNSSGMACGTQFNTYATLSSLKFVLASGNYFDSSKNDSDEELRIKEPKIYQGLLDLRTRIIEKPHLVEKIKKSYEIKNTMGYGINSFVDYLKPIDILTHLLVGSEGTLGFIAEATFNTIDLLPETATSLLIFENLNEATKALPSLKNSGAKVIELLDISSLKVAQREKMADSVLKDLVFQENAGLLVEYQTAHSDELDDQILQANQLFKELGIKDAKLTKDLTTKNELWHARKGLYAAVAGNRPKGTTALLEDISVPMQNLHETTNELSKLLTKHQYFDSVIFGHAKDGNLHFLLNEKFQDEKSLKRYEDFTLEMVDLVLSQEGSLKAEHGTGRIMAPFVKKQFGEELYQVMVDLKKLIDPTNLLNPGVIINNDQSIHIQNLKTSPTIDQEVDRCVECGYCETVCPSKDLTLTPRQRITLRRAEKIAQLKNDEKTLNAIKEKYDYHSVDTCAVDGMCKSACPVHINTGDLVKRLRSERQSFFSQLIGLIASKNWSLVTKLLSKVLTTAKKFPPLLVIGINTFMRQIGGNNSLPQWNPGLPIGGNPRKSLNTVNPDLVFFPSCVSSLFGESNSATSFLNLCKKAGLRVLIPEAIDELCCATPWSSKGLTQGYEEMALKTKSSLLKVLENPQTLVVSDSTSCSLGLHHIFEHTDIKILDVLEFVADNLLSKIVLKNRLKSLALHPTCSGVELGLGKDLEKIAHFISQEVVIAQDWSCCGFAGDRGLLQPELTKSATRKESQEINKSVFEAYASSNKPCQIALSTATGKNYVHIIELLDQLS